MDIDRNRIGIEKVTAPQALLSALLLCFVPCKSPAEWAYCSGGHKTASSAFQDACTGIHGGFVPSLPLCVSFFSSSSSLNSSRKVWKSWHCIGVYKAVERPDLGSEGVCLSVTLSLESWHRWELWAGEQEAKQTFLVLAVSVPRGVYNS